MTSLLMTSCLAQEEGEEALEVTVQRLAQQVSTLNTQYQRDVTALKDQVSQLQSQLGKLRILISIITRCSLWQTG